MISSLLRKVQVRRSDTMSDQERLMDRHTRKHRVPTSSPRMSGLAPWSLERGTGGGSLPSCGQRLPPVQAANLSPWLSAPRFFCSIV